jgi:hypothetical protein
MAIFQRPGFWVVTVIVLGMIAPTDMANLFLGVAHAIHTLITALHLH